MTRAELQDVQPERGKAVRLSTGEHLKIINTHGTQVVDMWAFIGLVRRLRLQLTLRRVGLPMLGSGNSDSLINAAYRFRELL